MSNNFAFLKFLKFLLPNETPLSGYFPIATGWIFWPMENAVSCHVPVFLMMCVSPRGHWWCVSWLILAASSPMVDQYDGKSSEVCTSPPVKEQYSGLVSCTVHYSMFEGISHEGITEVKLPGSGDNHKGTRGFSVFYPLGISRGWYRSLEIRNIVVLLNSYLLDRLTSSDRKSYLKA